MTKSGGKRGRRNKQLKCLTAAQGVTFKRPSPLLLVALIIARLTESDWFEGRRDYVGQIIIDKFPQPTDVS